MIDKITPRPDDTVKDMLEKDGVEGLDPIITGFKTYVAPFVNAEESEYLVIEDNFQAGRPALEEAGVIFTDRDTVNRVERMKVTTCLNPLHTGLAVYGCLLGYDRISAEMKDEDLVRLVNAIGYKEGLPVVTDPGVINPQEFIDTVTKVRLPNPFMPDTPQRIATDTSQKLSIRFGETIKSYMQRDNLSTDALKAVPLVLAGWLRYTMGVDDEGKAFTCSSDPLLEEVQAVTGRFTLGSVPSADELKKEILPVLKRTEIFGVDLEEAGLADRVVGYLAEELAGPGAVRETLRKEI
jgi:fructuronate reductase